MQSPYFRYFSATYMQCIYLQPVGYRDLFEGSGLRFKALFRNYFLLSQESQHVQLEAE